jgi:hypothetical protein
MGKVLITDEYGGGFPGSYQDRFDPVIIEAVESLVTLEKQRFRTEKASAIHWDLEQCVLERFRELGTDLDSIPSLRVVQLDSGTRFSIREYDGLEYIITPDDLKHSMP